SVACCCSHRASHYLLHLFVSLLPPPPTSTLFPYTTLFRSGRLHEERRKLMGVPAALTLDERLLAQMIDLKSLRRELRHLFNGNLDRKSTRLNSSHGSISYAVFCLKKKKKNT